MYEEIANIIDGKNLNEITTITKILMQYVLTESIAKSTIALLYTESEIIVKELAPNKLRNSIMDSTKEQITSQYGA